MSKTLFNIKLKAGALQYTIFVAVVIALLIFAFISLSYVQQRFKLKADNFSKVVHYSNLAIDYAQNVEIPYTEITTLQFSDDHLDNTTIQKKHWGVFDVVTATSSIKKEIVTKSALLGGFIDTRTSLYLQDDNQPFVLVGDSRIEGNVKLPKQGAKRGTIAGNAYSGSQLIYGSIGISNSELPQLKNKAFLKQLAQGTIESENNTSIELSENIRVLNSFSESTQTFFSSGSIDLREIELVGNIIIKSNTKITVYNSANLKDVLLVAPKIEIRDDVIGNFQVFATDEIIVGKNCKLKYPSTLIVYEKKANDVVNQNTRNEDFNSIEIQSGSEIKGVVGFLSDNEINNYKAQILVEDGAFIIGEIYNNQNLELKGTVSGSVFTKGFIANEFGSIYQNHVYNGKISTTDFPKQYSGFMIGNDTKSIAKWLY